MLIWGNIFLGVFTYFLYSYLNYPKHFTWIIGGGGDLLEDVIVGKNQFNPKFGVIWSPYSGHPARINIQDPAKNPVIEPSGWF